MQPFLISCLTRMNDLERKTNQLALNKRWLRFRLVTKRTFSCLDLQGMCIVRPVGYAMVNKTVVGSFYSYFFPLFLFSFFSLSLS